MKSGQPKPGLRKPEETVTSYYGYGPLAALRNEIGWTLTLKPRVKSKGRGLASPVRQQCPIPIITPAIIRG